MLLTITTTYSPATDLGYLLHKNPGKCQSFELPFGKAHVFYPEATAEQCTVALLLDIDPIGLVRKHNTHWGGIDQYVNDRPYVASSFVSVAISRVFNTALAGKCNQRPELVEKEIPLIVKIAVLPCRGGEEIIQRLFKPLGYAVDITSHPLDNMFPEWGMSEYYTVILEKICRLSELLTHLYVLIPVMDIHKHYWIEQAEVEKLLHHGEGWLSSHPEYKMITKRYLKHPSLIRIAMTQLLEEDNKETESQGESKALEEYALEKPIRLNEQRLTSVLEELKKQGVKRVLDLGCGGGKLIEMLLKERMFEEIVGYDVSYQSLEKAQARLQLERLDPKQRDRVKLLQGSLTYRDKRLNGYDAAVAMEVIEHLDIARLKTFERILFEFAKPEQIIITTPNIEYNCKFHNLPAGKFRHKDHRFEWTRKEFETWAKRVADKYGYTVTIHPVGTIDTEVGAPTQMGVFRYET